MRVFVTGGAGFIGSVTARALAESGHEVSIYDDFSTGHEWATGKARVFRGDVRDAKALERALRESRAEGVLHFAAKVVVPESVAHPSLYYDVNYVGGLRLLDAMRACGVKRLVFSSTAAVYGIPDRCPIDETAALAPINPYGRAKKQFEEVLDDERAATGLGYVSLRYFNACGAAPEWGLGEMREGETHLIPIVIKAAFGGPSVTVCGTDYPTRDGTGVRDYVDVRDLAEAHVRALERLAPGRGAAYNLGTERGTTVREVIAAVEKVSGRKVRWHDGPRRPGDPPALVASNANARRELGWVPKRGLEESIRAAQEFLQAKGGL